MADNTITQGAPGIAEYSSETWGNLKEMRLQDTPPLAVRRFTITASGADLTLARGSVVGPAGLAAYSATVAGKTAAGILPYDVFIADTESLEVDLIVAGHYDYEALTFAATFDSDAKKIDCFNGLGAPVNIILGTNPYDSDGVLA